MNLQKKCLNHQCKDYFPAKPLEFKFFCDKEECQKYFSEYHIYTLKSNRHIPANYFNLYDLDRPLFNGEFERVCRICGEPLFNKNGKYSSQKRYCNEHNGDALWSKYNWGYVSKNYAIKITEANQEIIDQKYKELIQEKYRTYKEIPEWIKKSKNLTMCEVCGKLCQIKATTQLHTLLGLNVINIHHKIPVHKLKWDDFHLIWDEGNLIALCEDCHKKQDHQLKTKADPFINFKRITNFM